MLMLGVAALCGIGLLRGDVVTAQPGLMPNPPATSPAPKADGSNTAPAIPTTDPIELPSIPSGPNALPPLPQPKTETPALVTPTVDVRPPTYVPIPPVKESPMKEPPLVLPEEPKTPRVEPKAAPKTNQPELHFESSHRTPGVVPAPMAVKTPAFSPNRVVPCLSIETTGPEAIGHGQHVTYEILVKNVGQVAVTHVRVEEELPPGAKFISAEPAGELGGDKVMWMIGSMGANDEKRIKVTVRPAPDGDLSTKPSLSYSTRTQMTVKVTRPVLTLTVTAPNVATYGDDIPVQIQVTNTGTGAANNVSIKALLTDGLKHPAGKDIEANLPHIAPGESQSITLKLQASGTGAHQCALAATCEGSPKAVGKADIQLNQPKLALALSGPHRCMVRAEPTFTLEIGNPGTSATQPVQIAGAFPEGLDFVSASDGGVFDPATRNVNWNLGPADAGTRRNLTVKTRCTSAGNLAVRVVAQAGPKLSARAEAIIAAEGVPALSFEVANLENPVEVGKETTYEIRIVNTGTCPCTNIRVAAITSEGLIPGTATGPVPYKPVGQALHFEPIPKLGVKADAVIKVKAKGTVAGDLRFKVQLSCDQLKQPVVKEESTSFFMP
jgi:uncharacterized repeat protein (TIGR01451 family)